MTNENSPKLAKFFFCKKCDYKCCKQSDYNKHILTLKHKIRRLTNENSPKLAAAYLCDCGKSYKHSSSLWNHKQKCDKLKSDKSALTMTDSVDCKTLLLQAMRQMQEQQEEMRKKDEMMAQMIEKLGNTTNINTSNNQFNINMFLNETCKDAINLSDFIESIEVSHNDLENNAQLGFVRGITKIIVDNLKQLTLHQRPIHCTDVKRETMYIKDQDLWEKEHSTEKISQAIREVSRKSIGSLMQWKQENPDYNDMDSDFSNLCIEIQRQSMAGSNRDTYYPKIMHNLAKENSISRLKLGI